MTDFPDLYILRHGQTKWNAEHRIQGTLDSPLTSTGIAQAKSQHRILSRQPLDGFQCFASPQGRAARTAEIALAGLIDPIVHDPRLVEIGVGDWEGQRRDQLLQDRPSDESEESALDLYERAPGGEGFIALRERCRGFLGDLQGPAVLVTHGITSRMLRLVLLDLDIADIGRLEGGQGNVYFLSNGEQIKLE